MNRRTFLSALAATSLTPLVPAQIFASGGIVNPDLCGLVENIGQPAGSWVHASTDQIIADIILPKDRYTRLLRA